MPTTKMTTESTEEGVIVHLQGRLDISAVGPLWTELAPLLTAERLPRLIVDCGAVTALDTAGIALFRLLENTCAERKIPFVLRGVPPTEEPFVRYVKEHVTPRPTAPPSPPPDVVSRLGQWGEKRLCAVRDFIRFVGDCAVAALGYLRNPRHMPARETLFQLQSVGPEAVPLVALLSALMGMIMVFQGLSSVQNFGSDIYIADMVVLAVTREMAPLLTAVIMAGRTGAAFAAEIGSMKIREEIDSLTVMNFDIAGFLVMPRVLALIIAGPLLTILADTAGILGGLLTSAGTLGLSPTSFIQEAGRALSAADIYSGIIKGTVFATLIGLIGCFCGLRTEQSATGVGVQATSAVVHGILLIILADGYLVAFFHIYNW